MTDDTESSHLFATAVESLADDVRVLAVYGFGSRARGDAGPASDVDLAVLLDTEIDLRDELRLRAAVVQALRRDDVDVVLLNTAPPLLCYEVVSTGVRLLARDERAADEFERRSFLRCCDTKHLRDVQRRIARDSASR